MPNFNKRCRRNGSGLPQLMQWFACACAKPQVSQRGIGGYGIRDSAREQATRGNKNRAEGAFQGKPSMRSLSPGVNFETSTEGKSARVNSSSPFAASTAQITACNPSGNRS